MSLSEKEIIDMFTCKHKEKYSIEPHGKGYALYFGRCQHKHGYNIMNITDCSRTDILKLIVNTLNKTEEM